MAAGSSDSFWGFGNVDTKKWFLNEKGIGPTAGAETPLTISSKQTTGADGGEYCIIWLGPEFPGDQRRDDEDSLTFDTPALITDMDIVGQPAVELCFLGGQAGGPCGGAPQRRLAHGRGVAASPITCRTSACATAARRPRRSSPASATA